MTSTSGESKSKGTGLMVLVAILTLVLVFFMWQRSRFARSLSDEQVLERLDPEISASEIQHALEQLYDRMSPTLEDREKFHEKVLALQNHPQWEVRRQVAWVMGRDDAEVYHKALVEMLRDEDRGVRLNAACALSNFNDPRARRELLEALEPWELKAPATGKVHWQIKEGESVSLGRDIGYVLLADEKRVPIRPALNGFADQHLVKKSADATEGQVIARISPDPRNVVNAVVALQAVGSKEDIPKLEALAEGRVPRLKDSTEVRSAARRAVNHLGQ